MLPSDHLAIAVQAVRTRKVFFSIGTSGLVEPEASLPLMSKEIGTVIIKINPVETSLTPFVD